MKILFINRWVGYNEGGNETHIKELMVMLSKNNHEIHIMTTGKEALKNLENKIKIWNVKSPHSYYYSQPFGYMKAMFFVFKAFFVFLKLWLKGERYDVISVHFSLEAFLARLLKAIFGIPYVMVFAGDTDLELFEGKYADVQIQISEYMAKECELYGYRPTIIPKGIDLTRFNPNVDGSEIRKKYAPNNEKIVLTVCRLEPRKNLETLILCANMLKNKNIENTIKPKFLIIGDGVEKDKLEKLIKEMDLQDMVIMIGPIPYFNEELPKYYVAADLFVLPTLYEGFGWVFMEAMACGLPIVTTNVGSNPEVLKNIGVLLPPRKPELFSQAILDLLKNEKERKKMRERGLEKVKDYDWNKIISRYELIYERASMKKENFIKRTILYILSMIDFIIVLLKKFKIKEDTWGPKSKIFN